MKTLNVSFYFPYNWYQHRTVKIRNKYNSLLGKIEFGKETDLNISNVNIKKLKFSTGFYACDLNLEQIEGKYGLVYFDIKNYLGLFNPKILQVKIFDSAGERSRFRNSLYTKPLKDKNLSIVLFGLFISFVLMSSGAILVEQEIWDIDDLKMIFIIGLTSFVSLGFLLRQTYTTIRVYSSFAPTIHRV